VWCIIDAQRQGVRVLVERYGAQRVWLFGSLARLRAVHNASDIDLAVEDLSSDQYFAALATLWDIVTDTDVSPAFTLDLVPLEDARPGLVNLIRTEGKLLYEPS
jgi:predicted nucleotidyltransferase